MVGAGLGTPWVTGLIHEKREAPPHFHQSWWTARPSMVSVDKNVGNPRKNRRRIGWFV